MSEKGILYVVATPIGNLQDMSERALAVLRQVAVIAAEDTRHSGKLLKHFGIQTPCVSLHEHNEQRVVPSLIDKLKQGADIALISDAGTPLISDPGFLLTRACVQVDINIRSVPGPCALIAALSISGLPADRFIFEGFLPAKQNARLKRLETLQAEIRTMIFYESCHRLVDSIEDMKTVFGGERPVVIVREITKMYEDVIRGSLIELCQMAASGDGRFRKGEFVVLIHGHQENQDEKWAEAVKILSLLMDELSVSQAAKLTSQITGVSKKRLYQYALDGRSDC